jgi:hypothetical protein
MGISMTNRLLGVVMAFALSSGIVAHAAQTPQRPLSPVTLESANALPMALQTAASHVAEAATGAIDPAAAIRAAYERDHVALEHLRQEAAPLQGSAHAAFNQYISDREGALAELERTALATARPAATTTIAAMDNLVTAAQTKLELELSQTGSAKSQDSVKSAKSAGESTKSQDSSGSPMSNSTD